MTFIMMRYSQDTQFFESFFMTEHYILSFLLHLLRWSYNLHLTFFYVVCHIDFFACTEPSWHPRDKSHWIVMYMIFLMCCWICFANIFLRIVADSVSFLFLILFIWVFSLSPLVYLKVCQFCLSFKKNSNFVDFFFYCFSGLYVIISALIFIISFFMLTLSLVFFFLSK